MDIKRVVGKLAIYLRGRLGYYGYTFRTRQSRNRKGKLFANFSPAVSDKSAKSLRRTMRDWGLHRRSDKSLEELARACNPVMRGWISYFTSYCKSAMRPTLDHLDRILVRWAMRKYKKLKKRQRKACQWLRRIQLKQPRLFAHWQFLLEPAGR